MSYVHEIQLPLTPIKACLSCPLCKLILKDAVTFTECLHTFCRKCVIDKLEENENNECPKCGVALGGNPIEKLRNDRLLSSLCEKLFFANQSFLLMCNKSERNFVNEEIESKSTRRSNSPENNRVKYLTGDEAEIKHKKLKLIHSSSILPFNNSTLNAPLPSQKEEKQISKLQFNTKREEKKNDLNYIKKDKIERCSNNSEKTNANNIESSSNGAQVSLVSEDIPNRESLKLDDVEQSGPSIREYFSNFLPYPQLKAESSNSFTFKKLENKKISYQLKQNQTQKPNQDQDTKSNENENENQNSVWVVLQPNIQLHGNAFLPQIEKPYLRIEEKTITIAFLKNYLSLILEVVDESQQIEIACEGKILNEITTISSIFDEHFSHSQYESDFKMGSINNGMLVLHYSLNINK